MFEAAESIGPFMVAPRRSNIGAPMIADGADHAMLQIVESDLVWEAINVQLGIVVAAWGRAVDEQAALSQASHIRERHRLVVKQQVRDRPGHARMIPPNGAEGKHLRIVVHWGCAMIFARRGTPGLAGRPPSSVMLSRQPTLRLFP
jgi:hypothetical protein